MNKQKPGKGIEWTRIVRDGEELPGATWNPTGGCFHGCTWRMPDGQVTECYAKTIAERFRSGFEHGFEHHYWRPHMLERPLRVKTPHGIFVGSMADLFGHWVPEEQIASALDTTRRAHWHIFQFLTKNPRRMADFFFPANAWAGFSIPAGKDMSIAGAERTLSVYMSHIARVNAPVRFISIEPLWWDMSGAFSSALADIDAAGSRLDWVIIGAASRGSTIYQPEAEWTQKLLAVCDGWGIPVFFKGNMEWPADDWRDSFPQPAPQRQRRLI